MYDSQDSAAATSAPGRQISVSTTAPAAAMPEARGPGHAEFPGVDLDMLAYDIADLLDRGGYPIDVASTHIRPALPAFLREITIAAAGDDSDWEEHAMHCSGGAPSFETIADPDAPLPEVPLPRRGRAPAMGYDPWTRTGRMEIGAPGPSEWYWRCPACRLWAGPYNSQAVNRAAADHRYEEHDQPAERRSAARVAARRVCPQMTAARLDDTVARLAAAHGLAPAAVQSAIRCTAVAIQGLYASHKDAVFAIGRNLGAVGNGDYGKPPGPLVRALVDAIAAELSHPGWLGEMMAADAARP